AWQRADEWLRSAPEEWRPWLARFAACVARACDALDAGNRWPTMLAAAPWAYGAPSAEWAWTSDEPSRHSSGGADRLRFTISARTSFIRQGVQPAVAPVRATLTCLIGLLSHGSSPEMEIDPTQTVDDWTQLVADRLTVPIFPRAVSDFADPSLLAVDTPAAWVPWEKVLSDALAPHLPRPPAAF